MTPLHSAPSVNPLQDEEFVRYLRIKNLQEEYIRDIGRIRDSVDADFQSSQDERVRSKIQGIELDKWHRNMLNSCIFPFTEAGQLSLIGYHFVRASPLIELGVSNLDFLVFNPAKGLAIVGEAKGSCNDEGIIISQMKERLRLVETHHEHLESRYLGSAKATDEFVVGVSWTDANRISKAILRRGGGIVVWQSGIDFKDEDVKLSIFVPGKEEGEVAKTMIHMDDELNRTLNDVKTVYEFKTFFLESHPVAKMTILTIADTEKSDEIFTFEDLESLVGNELSYCDSETVRRETNWILQRGLDIGFVKEEAPGAYKIGTRSKKAKNRYDELVLQWVVWAVQQDKNDEVTQKRAKLQEAYTEKRKSYSFVDET